MSQKGITKVPSSSISFNAQYITGDPNANERNTCTNVRDGQRSGDRQTDDDIEIETADFIPLVDECVSEGTLYQETPHKTTADGSFLSDDSEIWTKFTPTSVLYIFHDKLRREHPGNFTFVQDLKTLKFKCHLMFGDHTWNSSLHWNKKEAKHEVSRMAVRDLAIAYPRVLDDIQIWFEKEFGPCTDKSKLLDSQYDKIELIDDDLPSDLSSTQTTSTPQPVASQPFNNPDDLPGLSISDAESIPDRGRMQAYGSLPFSPCASRDRLRFHPYIDTNPSVLNALRATSLLYEWCSKRHVHAPEYTCTTEVGRGFSFDLLIFGQTFSGPTCRSKKDAKDAVSKIALNHFKLTGFYST